MLLNCGAEEDSWESLDCKEIKPVNPKGNQSWIFIRRTDVETPILWAPDVKNWLIRKRHWCWERLKAGGEGDDRGWDGWMASLTWWSWVWASSGSGWWTGRPQVLQPMGLQRVRHNWVTEVNWTEPKEVTSKVALVVKNLPAKRCRFNPKTWENVDS